MSRGRGRAAGARHDGDAGYVAIVTAILLPVLIGLTALAVDVSNWYLTVNKEQKAADAAALAGAIYLPEHFAQAKSVALAVAANNGFTDGKENATVSVGLGERPTQLRVTIGSETQNFFGSVLGLSKSSFSRDGVADFAGPLTMGSPCNVLGNEDMESSAKKVGSSACASNAAYWLNMAGGETNKARGDAVGAFWCSTPDDGKGFDGCQTSGGAPSSGGSGMRPPAVCNAEAGLTQACTTPSGGPRGYLYAVHVGPSAPGDMHIEVYDGEFAYTGNDCTAIPAAAMSVSNSYVTAAEAKTRYSNKGNDPANTEPGKPVNPYCSGDNSDGGNDDAASEIKTRFTIYAPSPSSADPIAGQKLCSTTVDGVAKSDVSTLATKLAAGGTGNALARYFHRWTDVCQGVELGAPQANGDYVVQVQTLDKNGNPGGGGQNRFSLRAYTGTGTNTSANSALNVTALQHESLFFNFPPPDGPSVTGCATSRPANAATFNLVRLPTGSGEHVLRVRYFDLGDANCPDTVTLYPPDNSTIGSGDWNPSGACVGSRVGADSGVQTGNLTNCAVTTTSGVSGGRWQVVEIKIPSGYLCKADSDTSKCWVTVKLSTRGVLNDTTTWDASLDGDPVRLIPD